MSEEPVEVPKYQEFQLVGCLWGPLRAIWCLTTSGGGLKGSTRFLPGLLDIKHVQGTVVTTTRSMILNSWWCHLSVSYTKSFQLQFPSKIQWVRLEEFLVYSWTRGSPLGGDSSSFDLFIPSRG